MSKRFLLIAVAMKRCKNTNHRHICKYLFYQSIKRQHLWDCKASAKHHRFNVFRKW